jgi:hypothetical protein
MLVVVFFAAAGVFGVLWSTERQNYRATISQLETARAEAKATWDKVKGNELQINSAVKQKDDIIKWNGINAAEFQKVQVCANAGHALAQALAAGDAAMTTQARNQLAASCP